MIEEEQLSEADILHFKEQNHRRVKRVVTLVAITLMLTAFVLVVLSLSLGSKIDDLGPYAAVLKGGRRGALIQTATSTLVSESLDNKLSSKDLFLGPKKNETSR